jgi:hypothetical protein
MTFIEILDAIQDTPRPIILTLRWVAVDKTDPEPESGRHDSESGRRASEPEPERAPEPEPEPAPAVPGRSAAPCHRPGSRKPARTSKGGCQQSSPAPSSLSRAASLWARKGAADLQILDVGATEDDVLVHLGGCSDHAGGLAVLRAERADCGGESSEKQRETLSTTRD